MSKHSRKHGKVNKYQRVNAQIEEVPSYYFNGHWVTTFTQAYTPTVRPLSQRQRQVFDVLTDHVRSKNLVRMTHIEIAELLDVTANTISKAISALCQRGVICKHHNYVYEIDPGILWWGNRKDYFEAPSNSSPKTHNAIEFYADGKKKTTLHFPVILTYEKYQRRYGRLQSSNDGEHGK